MNGTSPAATGVTAYMGARKSQHITQVVNQQHTWFHFIGVLDTVYRHTDFNAH